MNARIAAAVVALLIAPASGLLAQTAGADTTASARTTGDVAPQDTFRLQDLVVTAARVPLPASAIPAAVTVVDRADIEASGAHHLVDVLRDATGATLVQAGPYGSAASLFMRGGESDYVKVLVDGVPVNQPGGAIDLSTLSLEDVQRVEIVRGPASVLYGSDAVSGVVQIFTRQGSGPPSIRAAGTGGSHGTWQANVSASAGSPSLDASASLSRFASDGVYAFNNQYRNDVAAGRVDVRPSAGTAIRATLRWNDSEYHYPTDGAGNVVDRNTFQTTTRTVADVVVTQRLTDRLSAQLELGYAGVASGLTDRSDGPRDTLGSFAYAGHGAGLRRSAEARASADLGAALLTAGASVESEHEGSAGTAYTQYGDYPSAYRGDRTDRGAYGEVILRPTPGLTATGGLRLDRDDAFGSFVTYRTGVSWQALRSTRLRAALGTAFKEPTILENFGVGFARGNPELRPERSLSWEVGLDRSLLDGRVRLEATWFDQRFRDMIDYDAAPPSPDAPNYYNIAGARARGLELTARARLTAAVSVEGGFTRLETETTDTSFVAGPDALFAPGAPLLRRPTNAGHVGVRLEDAGGARGTLTVTRTGSRWDLDYADYPAVRVRLAPYTRVDATASVPVVTGRGPGFRATLRVENLLNAAYQDVLHFPGRGRTVLIGGSVVVGG